MRAIHEATAALPFLAPAATHHRIPIRRGDTCPRCGSTDVRPWGGFSGRRRFRCRACTRTFSTFTLTSLHYVKRIDRWSAFLRCMDRRLTIRESADTTGVHKDTAFRWRHRVLAEWRRIDDAPLNGHVAMGRMYIAPNEKGSRSLRRPPRRRAVADPFFVDFRWRVVIGLAWAGEDSVACEMFPAGVPGVPDPHPELVARLGRVTELECPPHQWRMLSDFMERGGARYLRPEGRPTGVWSVDRRLTRWLKSFRGVATRYLPYYLQWFRTGAATGSAGVLPSWPPPQQLLRTATYGTGIWRAVGLRSHPHAPARARPPSPE